MPLPPLATSADVAEVWRTLTSTESTRADALCTRASTLVRHRMPNIDERIGWADSDPDNPAALDPIIVATVVAQIVKRTMANPDGVWSQSTAEGPFSESKTFPGSRQGENAGESPGELRVTDADLADLAPARMKNLPSTIRVTPTLAPPCVGDQVSVVI